MPFSSLLLYTTCRAASVFDSEHEATNTNGDAEPIG
jgi:hypothetical protein